MSHVVVRFAPSPTGYLHIGGARTAIFNWLYARKHNGKFILRIEDTDADRSTADAIDGILNGLKWLGLDWDEGPYFQSDFIDEHRAAAQQLLNSGTAYKCFCTKSELEQKREQARKNKMTYRYDGTCRGLSENQVAKKEADGNAFTIRFKVPRHEGGVAFEDAVYGPIEKQFADIEDFIIVRANGQPLYVLSNAVDDIRDGITHIIRGQDGLSNTPKQVLLYKALGASLPRFAHMSLTLDPQKAKISKRKHGEQVAVHYYREKGFLPWAMVNFLVLLGWATSDSREIFSPQELIKAFNLKGIGRTNSVFNIKADADELVTDPKLRSINSHYLRTMPLEELIPYVETQLKQAGIWSNDFLDQRREWFTSTLDLIRGRFHLLTDFSGYGRTYFNDTFDMDPKAVKKHLSSVPSVAQWLPALIQELDRLEPFDSNTVENALKLFLSKTGIKPGLMVNAVRTAVTGQGVGPDFVRVLACLGRRSVVSRLKHALDLCDPNVA
jgi:glutamyl-tRNA synthetase